METTGVDLANPMTTANNHLTSLKKYKQLLMIFCIQSNHERSSFIPYTRFLRMMYTAKTCQKFKIKKNIDRCEIAEFLNHVNILSFFMSTILFYYEFVSLAKKIQFGSKLLVSSKSFLQTI